MSTKRKIIVTPVGTAIYPKLMEPDTKFKAEGVYSLKLVLSEKDAQELRDEIEKAEKQAEDMFREKKPKAKAVPWQETAYKKEEDEDGAETGNWIFNIKMTASGVSKKTGKPWKMAPRVFDAKGVPIKQDVNIWSGSKVKVALQVNHYFHGGKCGASLRLEAVQIIELASGNSGTADQFGFKEEDGYNFSEEDVVTKQEFTKEGDNGESQEDESETDF